jgi:hypothetical protein
MKKMVLYYLADVAPRLLLALGRGRRLRGRASESPGEDDVAAAGRGIETPIESGIESITGKNFTSG